MLNELATAEWVNKAACRGDAEEILWISEDPADQADAISFCKTVCTVRNDCLEYAIRAPETSGIWGGHLPGERRVMRAHRRRKGNLT